MQVNVARNCFDFKILKEVVMKKEKLKKRKIGHTFPLETINQLFNHTYVI